ncbi:MAG: lysophospholipid acyltransferase family protein, partial [Planctomycetota bacterium]
LMVCEIVWAQRRIHLSNWRRHATFRNNCAILRNLISDRPTILVTGHFGNFEIGSYINGLMGFESKAIARRLDNPYLEKYVHDFRSATGQHVVDKDGCAAEIDAHLAAGGQLSILADQHAGPKGCWEMFMGQIASCHKALALFSIVPDAPMVLVYTIRTGRPMQFQFGCTGVVDPLDSPQGYADDVSSLTAWYNRRLEDAVRIAPPQYWWLHNRWREPPEKIRKRLAKRQEKERKRSAAA